MLWGSGGLKLTLTWVGNAWAVVAAAADDPVCTLKWYVDVPSVMLTTNGREVVEFASGVMMRFEMSLYTPVAPAVKSVCAVVVLRVASCAGEI